MNAPRPMVHFGGPDKPPRVLRDLLVSRVEAVPPGGTIVFATYYFRDRDLANALIAASQRGVAVTAAMEAMPRLRGANDAVLGMLRADAFRGRLVAPEPRIAALHPHLHTKIYYFSHPVPTALVGSFNPSGDEPEDAAVIAKIGDQDRGDNLLVELTEPRLAEGLRRHAERIHAPLPRLRNAAPLEASVATAYFYPRFDTGIAKRKLAGATRIEGCVSHLKPGRLTRHLARLASRGSRVRLLVHDTERRVPQHGIEALRSQGVEVRRIRHPEGLPMHAKFLIADDIALFGSFNFNPRSRWLNHEVLLASSHPAIVEPLRARFREIAGRVSGAGSPSGR